MMWKTIRSLSILYSLLFISAEVSSQTARITGKVVEAINNQPVPFATIAIEGTTTGTFSDAEGNFILENVAPGTYNLSVSFVGFKKKMIFEYEATVVNPKFLEVRLEAATEELDAVEIKTSAFNKSEESPLSMQTINQTEIQRNPGGNRDISRVIQSLPGVASSISFRNDIIIRGGAPNENRFYLDGIEVPNINHFATQGSSGGPVGMINVDLIREVDFYTSAFPGNRYNAMSSVMDLKMIEGNKDKLAGRFTIGSSDLAMSLNGPISENSTLIISARRSYLQFLFAALQLPFLPTYNDFQFKYKWNISPKDQLSIIGLGAIDEFSLNEGVNDGITDPETIERNTYFLDNIGISEQWNYTVGANYKHFRKNSYQTIVVSRNHLNNSASKYYKNDDSSEENLILDYISEEIENKVRLENHYSKSGLKLSYGLSYEYVNYLNSTYSKTFAGSQVYEIDYNSALYMNKYGAFVQAGKAFFDNRLTTSLGLRTDISDYSSDMSNPLDQISPRLALSYSINEKLSFNANTGIYYQLPPYTALGYRNGTGELVNKENDLKYIRSIHYVAGFQYYPNQYTKFSVEGFLKQYSQYPFLIGDSISMANQGADFGVIGNEPVTSISKGRSYGTEFLIQQKLQKGFYGILAYTIVVSEFEDKNGNYVPSSWDFGHIVSMTGGKKFKKNWELGMRWRFTGRNPYTPYNVEASSRIEVWDVRGSGVPDYDRLNQNRTAVSHGLDVRLDKKYFFKNWGLNLYLDIQNIYNYATETAPILNMRRDAEGNAIEDPNRPGYYIPYEIPNESGTILPTIGVIVEF